MHNIMDRCFNNYNNLVLISRIYSDHHTFQVQMRVNKHLGGGWPNIVCMCMQRRQLCHINLAT